MGLNIVITLLVAGITIYSTYAQTATHRSCKELKNAGNTGNGLYWINTNVGVIQVYCDMTTENGGWTYLPTSALAERNLQLHNILTEYQNVLLRIKNKDGTQESTKITPLNGIPFNVMVNSHNGYTKPLNEPHLGSFLFFGILPNAYARNHQIQGFKSNNRNVQFKNCDSNPNSYFAFFPNFHGRHVSSYHKNNLVYERHGVAVNWRGTGINSNQQLPDNYFFLTELHFGGCGTYTSSDRWNEAEGTAIGLR